MSHKRFAISPDHPDTELHVSAIQVFERKVPDVSEKHAPPITALEWESEGAMNDAGTTTLRHGTLLVMGDQTFSRFLPDGKKLGFVSLSMGNAAIISSDSGFLDEYTEGEEVLVSALRQLPPGTPLNVIQVPGWRQRLSRAS